MQTLQFQVQAIAGELGTLRVSTATIQLEITDTNDNSPQFSSEEYHVKVPESVRYPAILLTVDAVDKDSGKFGQILYSVSGDGADIFVIEGIIFFFIKMHYKKNNNLFGTIANNCRSIDGGNTFGAERFFGPRKTDDLHVYGHCNRSAAGQ